MNAYAVLNILILLFVHLPAYIYAREGTSASNLKSITKLLTTSEKPVVLANFTRIGQRNGNEISLRPRTIPEVFERALELKRGKPFEFRVDKWRKLLASKLFRGLSAHISKDDKGRAFIQISGTEVPAITFSPEVSAGLSGFDPDVSGGINYEDNNLLGLGQRLSVSLSNRDAENRLGGLAFPQRQIRWGDFCVGQKSKVEISYDENLSKEHPESLGSTKALKPSTTGVESSKCVFQFRRFAAKFTDDIFLSNKVRPIEAEVEPYYLSMTEAGTEGIFGPGLSLRGARFAVDLAKSRAIGSLRLWLDQGLSSIFGSSIAERFFQWGSDFSAPTRLLCTTVLPNIPFLPLPSNSSRDVDVVIMLAAKSMFSAGKGKIPLYHHSDLGEAKVLRGLESGSSAPPASAFLAIKSDIIAVSELPLSLGLFLDGAIFRSTEAKSDRGSIESKVTAGVSARAMGFLVEVGWPVDKFISSTSLPRVYFGIDSRGR